MTITLRRARNLNAAQGVSSITRAGLLVRTWAVVGAAILLAGIIGCATSPAYKSLFAVGHAVDTSVTVYFDLVVKGVVPTNDVPKVARAYNAFQLVYSNAVVLMKFNSKAPPDTNIIARAGEMLSIVARAQGGESP